jgi:hypothetical protein
LAESYYQTKLGAIFKVCPTQEASAHTAIFWLMLTVREGTLGGTGAVNAATGLPIVNAFLAHFNRLKGCHSLAGGLS